MQKIKNSGGSASKQVKICKKEKKYKMKRKEEEEVERETLK